jgi:ketosteroid isomerase-like protein
MDQQKMQANMSTELLQQIYLGFNARDIDAVLTAMHPDVVWPNGMEGGSVFGHDGIRDYWTRQWSMINPRVEPKHFTITGDGRIAVEVHQVVCDLSGNLLKDAMVQHIYTFEDSLIKSMEIREDEQSTA